MAEQLEHWMDEQLSGHQRAKSSEKMLGEMIRLETMMASLRDYWKDEQWVLQKGQMMVS